VARSLELKISLIPCTSKLGLGTLFDYPNEGPGACAELSSINLNLSVHLSDSANKDSLKSMHTLISLRSGGVYVGHTTGQPSVGYFEGTSSYVLRLSSKRPSVFESLLSKSRHMQKLSSISVH